MGALETIVTNGIKVSVETFYQEQHSNPVGMKYVFAYRITIENMSPHTVQLMRRHWFITEANGKISEVEGEGVIGEKPILRSGEIHQYVSWTHLSTEIGKMTGTYLFVRQTDGQAFKAKIPKFLLTVPYKLN